MARLPRLVLPGHAHCIIQRGHSGQPVFMDAADRQAFGLALRDALSVGDVQLHAWALLDSEVQLLATPTQADALGRLMQAVGRRYVSAYNRRHGRTGTLWDGRFRCAVVEPGPWLMTLLAWIDGQSLEPGITSAAHRLGGPRDPLLADPPGYWQLGNTPFERESVYRQCLAEGLPAQQAGQIRRAALGGWALGSDAFAARLGDAALRPVRPRQPGRPRHRPA